MLSMICHPEAHPLREGSPGMSRTQMHFLGSSAYGGLVRGGGALRSAFLSEASREILRANPGVPTKPVLLCGVEEMRFRMTGAYTA